MELPRVEDVGEGGVIFVLERASLEVGKFKKKNELLDCHNCAKDPEAHRPDITHQALLAILDSPLNKAGKLKGLFVQTEKNVLIQVSPQMRIPRTFPRFSGLMRQLLEERTTNGPEELLRIVKQPVSRYFPAGARKIGMSFSAKKTVRLQQYISDADLKGVLVFVVGAMAHGKIEADYADDLVSVSQYPLGAACCIGRICYALEQKWDIV